MDVEGRHLQLSSDEVSNLIDLTDAISMARSLNELLEHSLPKLSDLVQSPSAFIFLNDPRLLHHRYSSTGFNQETSRLIEEYCANLSSQPIEQTAVTTSAGLTELSLYPLNEKEEHLGYLGFPALESELPISTELWQKIVGLLSHATGRLVERTKSERQLEQLNTYLTVSSLLAQPIGLHDMLEAALFCCTDAVSAEAASVLLVDDKGENFHFYQVEGEAKEVLMTETFPIDKGLAGHVLSSLESEVINNAQNDPRFYNKIDKDSGFQTRNMIAVPLVAGDEKIGVLEVLNKIDNGDFSEEERLLLLSIAEEIAFAIRNAKIFEYVVKSYCKQKQGQLSCRGCDRPLGSWTPCVKYREEVI
jgi:GAF domain-containing protein